jgi:predicted ATP-dependent protease
MTRACRLSPAICGAPDKPLSLAASLCFEQSYGGVEGDSASAAEIFALLSALSNLPIRQEVAVTGSISQEGDIQPIGGVNQKIEGFFDACRVKGGLTGGQGVLIPAANIEDLMLREEVVDAVARGEFQVFPIATIEEGIEILTGQPAGRRKYGEPSIEGSIFALVDQRLREMAEILREYE